MAALSTISWRPVNQKNMLGQFTYFCHSREVGTNPPDMEPHGVVPCPFCFLGDWCLWYQVSSRRVGMSRRWVPTHQTCDLRGWPHVLSGGLVSLVPGLGGWVVMWVPTPRHGTSGSQVLSGGWYLCYQGPGGGDVQTWDLLGHGTR